jgi:hypothetical protein
MGFRKEAFPWYNSVACVITPLDKKNKIKKNRCPKAILVVADNYRERIVNSFHRREFEYSRAIRLDLRGSSVKLVICCAGRL